MGKAQLNNALATAANLLDLDLEKTKEELQTGGDNAWVVKRDSLAAEVFIRIINVGPITAFSLWTDLVPRIS